MDDEKREPVQPNRSDFDPMSESYWSLAMALAWIMFKDADLVRECWGDWRAAGFAPLVVSAKHNAITWEQRDDASLLTIDLLAGREQARGRVFTSRTDARKQLWSELEKGRLAATGVPSAGGDLRTAIHSSRWRDLQIDERSRPLALIDRHGGPQHGYREVEVDATYVRKKWTVRPRTPGRMNAETHCREWLVGLMRESPTFRPKPKPDFRKEAQKRFPNLSGASFDKAWRSAVGASNAPAWSASGRPRKS